MRSRPALVLWVAGMPGVVALALTFAARMPPSADSVPVWLVILVATLQYALLLALAVTVGARLAPRVGLNAPAFAALAGQPGPPRSLRAAALPALLGGIAGGAVIAVFPHAAPASLAALGAAPTLPLSVRILYGGITEEILLRWGLMTFLVWLGWRTVQRGRDLPSAAVAWTAVAGSAVAFGALHLPAVAAVVGTLTPAAAAYVIAANSAFGLVAGWLFLRHGLEAAIAAHVLAHVSAFMAQAAIGA